jgi:hypothetical protein
MKPRVNAAIFTAAAACLLTIAAPRAARAEGGVVPVVDDQAPTGFHIELRPHGSSELKLAYRVGDPIPAGYSLESRPSKGLLVGGGVTLGVSYALGVIVGTSMGHEGGYAAIPIAGPFIAGATYHTRSNGCVGFEACLGNAVRDSIDTGLNRPLLYALGGVEVLGGALIAVGLLSRAPVLVPEHAPLVLPVVTADRVGLSMTGSF